MVAHTAENTGRLDFMALKDHYEGVGVHAVFLVQANKVLRYFFIRAKRDHTCGGTNLRVS